MPDAMKSISGMLNLSNQAQQLRQGNVALQKEQIVLGERKGIQELFKNPAAFTGEDGQPDFNKLINEGMKVAPTTFPTMVPQIIQAHKSGLDAKAALNTLTGDQRNQVGQYVMSLSADTPDVARKKLDGLIETNPQLKPAVDFAWKYSLEPSAKDPAAWKNAVLKVGQSAMAPTAQATAMTPSGPQVSNNVQTGTINLNPMAGPTGIVPETVVNQQLPLGERQNVTINPVTQSPQTVTKDAFGNVRGVTATPTGGGVPQLAPGQPQDLPIITKERADLNSAAAQVPTQRFNNRQIISLSDSDLLNTSGTGAQRISAILGAVGVPAGSDYATNVQKLGHYLALQAQSNAKVMGATTDQSREVSEAASGSLKMTPDALKSVAKVNDAFATGLENYNKGMEAAIRNAGGNVLAARDFKNAWSASFDPNVYRYANALESGDKREIDAILGKPGSAERTKKARELAVKSQRLYQLSTGGQVGAAQ